MYNTSYVITVENKTSIPVLARGLQGIVKKMVEKLGGWDTETKKVRQMSKNSFCCRQLAKFRIVWGIFQYLYDATLVSLLQTNWPMFSRFWVVDYCRF